MSSVIGSWTDTQQLHQSRASACTLWEAPRLFTTVFHCWTKMDTGLEARLELLGHRLGTTGLAP